MVLHHGTWLSAVEHNEIPGNLGHSNVTAGILITDREVNLPAIPERYSVPMVTG
jgi:hypothetical protein